MAPRETKAIVYLDRIKIFLFFFSVQKNFPVKESDRSCDTISIGTFKFWTLEVGMEGEVTVRC